MENIINRISYRLSSIHHKIDHKENNDAYSDQYSNNNQYIVKVQMKSHINKTSEESNIK